MTTPIKRHTAMQALSRDHHHGLLLSWKLREGMKRNIDAERMMKYVRWFWITQLKPHFEEEEKYVFTVLDSSHPQIIQALEEHRSLEALFAKKDPDYDLIGRIEKELDAHIRFEERVLFNAIQEAATEDQLEKIREVHHEDPNCEAWADEFWI